MGPLDILILEDSEEDLLLLLHTLNKAELDFTHRHVVHEQEYIEALNQEQPDIVLSDYGLIGYDGLKALRELKGSIGDCPFILVTGSLPDDLAVECMKAGADDYILKDRLNRLPDAIRQTIERRRAERDRHKAFSEMQRSQRRLQAAEKMAMVGSWEWHLGSGEVVWSDQMYRIVGKVPGEYTPDVRSFKSFTFEEDRKWYTEAVKSISIGQEQKAESTFRIKTPEGETKMVRGIYSSNGKTIESGERRLFGTMQDITRQWLTEKRLRELTEKLEQKVQERTEAYRSVNEKLSQRNLELMDSVNYANLIQKALLPQLGSKNELIDGSFVIWKPRDGVSGDFYWKARVDSYVFIAAVDCTGHGVPGALMSMIGHQLLREVVVRDRITDPAEILTELDLRVSKALYQEESSTDLQDGMDLVLCRIDRDRKEVCFAGALRPLFYVSEGVVSEYRGSRSAIGGFRYAAESSEFTQETLSYKNGDMIYLTSDGYYDQFGGPQGRKMLKSRFRDRLPDIAGRSLEQQHDALIEWLDEWQGDVDQVDDILVIGVRL